MRSLSAPAASVTLQPDGDSKALAAVDPFSTAAIAVFAVAARDFRPGAGPGRI